MTYNSIHRVLSGIHLRIIQLSTLYTEPFNVYREVRKKILLRFWTLSYADVVIEKRKMKLFFVVVAMSKNMSTLIKLADFEFEISE